MMTHHIAKSGGSYIRAHSLARHLIGLGHTVTLVAASKQFRWRKAVSMDGVVPVIEMPGMLSEHLRHGGLDFTEWLPRLAFAQRQHVDIVHGFGHRPSVCLPALINRRHHKTPYIVDWADLWGKGGISDQRGKLAQATLGQFDHYLEQWVNQQADGLTVICSDLYHRLQKMPSRPTCIIPVGASVDVIQVLSRDEMREKYQLPQDAHIAVFSGYTGYDADLLGYAFVEIARRDPKAMLLITGNPAPQFQHIVREANLTEQIIDVGVVPYHELGSWLACGDVMLLPYTDRTINRGRYPGKVGDYLAAGRPIITNPTGDVADLIRAEQVGLLVAETPVAFADAAITLFNNPQLSAEFGQNARHTAERKLDWKILAGQTLQFYNTVLGQ